MQREPLFTVFRFAGGFLGAVATLVAIALLTNNGAGLL